VRLQKPANATAWHPATGTIRRTNGLEIKQGKPRPQAAILVDSREPDSVELRNEIRTQLQSTCKLAGFNVKIDTDRLRSAWICKRVARSRMGGIDRERIEEVLEPFNAGIIESSKLHDEAPPL
jgi:hypothetical protein